MASAMIDSVLFANNYSMPEVRQLFDDTTMVQNWLDIESALAQTQAEMGIIPQEAADEISRKAHVENLDLTAIGHGVDAIHHSLVPTLRALQSICENGAGEYIHMGLTTQDVIDTGFIISLKKGFKIIYDNLRTCEDHLLGMIKKYRDTAMAGRSHTQQGVPITFGYKCANWASEIERDLLRMESCYQRCFVGELFGALGTMAGFGPRGMEVSDRTIKRLGLDIPNISWHTSRDRMAEICHVVSIACCTLGRMGNELAKMQMTEIGEVAEGFTPGEVSSSTMPHKRNPNGFEALQCLARLVKGEAATAQESMFCEHERDGALWKIEWKTVNECIILASACSAKGAKILENLQVYPERMQENLFIARGLMMSERVMMALGQKIGKQTAHEVVYEIAMKTFEGKHQFRDMLLDSPIIMANLSEAEIDELLDPNTYTGLAGEICDRVVAAIKISRSKPKLQAKVKLFPTIKRGYNIDEELRVNYSGA